MMMYVCQSLLHKTRRNVAVHQRNPMSLQDIPTNRGQLNHYPWYCTVYSSKTELNNLDVMTDLYSLLSSHVSRPDCVKRSLSFFWHTYTLYGNTTFTSKKMSVPHCARHAQSPPPSFLFFPFSFFFLNYCNNSAPPQPKKNRSRFWFWPLFWE